MFNFRKKENKDKKEDKDKTVNNIGTAVVIDASVKNSVNQAQARYSKPDYNPQTRLQYYDNSSMHKTVMDKAFANGEIVKDPYSGAELVRTQMEAKAQYGEAWQNHAAEADHIDPLSQVVKRNSKNPFLTTSDIKDIGNSEDNFQILARNLNQGSKTTGKGGSTQYEWAEDSARMEGLTDTIQSGESIDVVSKRIIDNGKAAEKRNKVRALKKSAHNVVETAQEAGKDGAKYAGTMAAVMSGITNIVSVIKGEKSSSDAVVDTVKDGGKAAVTGYAMNSSLTIMSQTLSASSSEFMQALVKNNVPGRIITAVMVTGDTLKKWGNGEITTQECLIQLGDKGLNMATMGYSMAVGQELIPIPVVGGAIGALVGAMLTSNLYAGLIDELQMKQLEHEERMKRIAFCNEVADQMRRYRAELETYLDSYFVEYKSCFDEAISSMQLAFEAHDANGIISNANMITRKLGGQVKYETVDEFAAFLESDEDDIL